jgi:uncharacterized secreted protein with C-terminal beta-propeller domain
LKRNAWTLFLAAAAVLAAGTAPAFPEKAGPVAVNAAQADSIAEIGNAASDIRIMLYGEPFRTEQSPLLVDGVTLVPLRSIAESLGAEVSWNEEAQEAVLRKGSSVIALTAGSSYAVKNGETIRLEAAPRLANGVMMVPLRLIGESFDALVTWNAADRVIAIDRLPELPTVGSYENMKALLEKAQQSYAANARIAVTGSAGASTSAPPASVSEQAAAAPAAKQKADFSATNTQVEGVDEADIVKTDGTYIYHVNGRRVVITQAVPAAGMNVSSVIEFADETFHPNEIYADGRYLIVVGTSYYAPIMESAPAVQEFAQPALTKKLLPTRHDPVVRAIVYDVSDKSSPKKVREAELDGSYVASRKIGSSLYLITNKYAGFSYILRTDKTSGDASEAETAAPKFKDSILSDEAIPIDYPVIRYFPGSPEAAYMLVAGLNLDRPDQPINVSAYLGSGQHIYASESNLYAAVTKYAPVFADPSTQEVSPDNAGTSLERKALLPRRYTQKTAIYKFRLEQGTTKFVAEGEVPGTVLNQFSMDEFNGIFRIATTTSADPDSGRRQQTNNLYTLDEGLKPLGKLEGIAPDERIYSVRYMGNRAYMVTFKNVDPLFAIDLSNPAAPSVLGALKIPGYSDYLHPYSENLLIGFGKDTEEVPVKGGAPGQTVALVKGMKLSLFDVSDVSNPIELHKEIIGDRGTDSELLHNHKALMFSREHALLAFPVTVMGTAQSSDQSAFADTSFQFQGAYVYRIDPQSGFDLKARITHLTKEDQLKSGMRGYAYNHHVERILYIGDTLYTLSPGKIKANSLATFEEIGSLVIE